MILHLTEKCNMSCKHCMHNCDMNGRDMEIDVFIEAIKFIQETSPKILLLSGGEPTLHANFIDFLDVCINTMRTPKRVIVTSNGTFLENEDLTHKIIERGVSVQITNDAKYYPKQIKKIQHENFIYINEITHIFGMGRAKTNKLAPGITYPKCFNLISASKKSKDLKEVVSVLEGQAHKFCSVGINVNGDISLGEAFECMKVGNIKQDNLYTIHKNIKDVKLGDCNKCNLEKNLNPLHKSVYC